MASNWTLKIASTLPETVSLECKDEGIGRILSEGGIEVVMSGAYGEMYLYGNHLFMIFFLAIAPCLYVLLVLFSPCKRQALESELRYKTCQNQGILGSVFDAPTHVLTVVVPAYNELKRLNEMLRDTIAYLNSKDFQNSGSEVPSSPCANGARSALSETWEILVIDDGSTDGTAAFALEIFATLAREGTITQEQAKNCKVISLGINRGKGGAVQHGISHASGREILYADADGASRFSDLAKLRRCLVDCQKSSISGRDGIAVGSRAHMVNSEAVVKRSFVRNALMHSFHLLLSVFAISSIADTQCGFKLLSRETARRIISSLHVQGWIFDVELLILAQNAGLKLGPGGQVREVYIQWSEKEGSKINLIWDSMRMLRDLVIIRVNYLLGRWRLLSEEELQMEYEAYKRLRSAIAQQ